MDTMYDKLLNSARSHHQEKPEARPRTKMTKSQKWAVSQNNNKGKRKHLLFVF